ncbi:MAG: SGNH/GDSL hydrolase family protein [Eubacterium sp.]
MRGPKAPKDPTKKRPCLYLMLDKDIAGMPTRDGACRDTNFMEGRLVEQVKGICGDVDKDILKLLESFEGIRKLVHSVGVSITAHEESEKSSYIDFTINCYGKVDKYVTGSNITVKCPCNGEEVMIELEKVPVNEMDDIIGQFDFNFPKDCKSASVTLKFYLNDGYTVPEIAVDPPIDFESDAYRKMIDRSLLSLGNVTRLKTAIEKAERGEDVTIAYIGGSITQGAGAKPIESKSYAYLSYRAFCEKFTPDDGAHVTFVKAGVGGTPSELGMIRYEKEVTDYGKINPDIVIVEFAVNDEGDETEGVCFESLVRKIAKADNKPAVILNFAVFMNEWNLEDRLVPVGECYDLPMVSVKAAVVPQFSKDTIVTKRQYFYDIFHPTNDGHHIMADCLVHLFDEVKKAPMPQEDSDFTVNPAIGAEFEDVILVDASNIDQYGKVSHIGFDYKDTEIQYVERNLSSQASPVLENGWAKDSETTGAEFVMEIAAKNIVLVSKDSGTPKFGKADVYVDDTLVLTADPLVNGWNHCNPQIILNDKESAKHIVKIVMHPGDEEKAFTILGFGVTL